jgi:hypothetical protein
MVSQTLEHLLGRLVAFGVEGPRLPDHPDLGHVTGRQDADTAAFPFQMNSVAVGADVGEPAPADQACPQAAPPALAERLPHIEAHETDDGSSAPSGR